MLKIGFITSSLSSKDGWGRYSKSLIEAIAKSAEVAAITERDAHNEAGNFPVFAELPGDLEFGLITQIKVLYSALKRLRGCDVIHSLVEPYAPGAAIAARLLGAKFIMTLHGTYAIPPSNFSLKRLMLKIAYGTAAITTTGSAYTETKARERLKFGECRFIPNGVDPIIFHCLTGASDKNFLLTVGWLKPRKGMDIFIRAFNEIKYEFPELKCKLAGGVGNEKFFDHLKSLVKENHLEKRVEFLGRVSDEELRKLYNECSIFVFPARDIDENFEGFPMVFYEANACGAPVITTRGFGSEYAIKDGYNGLLVEPESVGGAAEAIRKILKNPDLHSQMRKNALETAANHTWGKIAENHLIKMYQDALKK